MTRACNKLVVIFCIFSSINFKCSSYKVTTELLPRQDSLLTAQICNCVKGIVGNDKQISTASISILRNNFELSLVDDIVRCLPKLLAVTVTDYRSQKLALKANTRKSMIEIVVADEIKMVMIFVNHVSKDGKKY